MGYQPCPSSEIELQCLIESHCSINTHHPPEQEFYFVLCERAEFTCVRFKPDVPWSVRASHPVRKPMIELAGRLVCICWIPISRKDSVFLGGGHSPRTVIV